MMPKKISKSGFTLMEVTITLTLITIGIVGVLGLFYFILGLTTLFQNQLIAVYLAQEGIEIIRNIRDTNWLQEVPWDEGLTGCQQGCIVDFNHSYDLYENQFLNLDQNGFYSYSPGEKTKFQRKITILPQDLNGDETNDLLKVEVLVQWQQRQETHFIRVMETLYNWK
jgi:prepilin-type N-terminal cleavage/methylation domain-containing protein